MPAKRKSLLDFLVCVLDLVVNVALIMRMPEVLANATEAIIAKWLIQEGGSFTLGQAIAEVETEKAIVEVPAESNGILGKYLALDGASVQVGEPIAILLADGEGQAEIDRLMAEVGVDSPVAIPVATPVQTAEVTTVATPVQAVEITPVFTNAEHGDRLFISPLSRRLAKENGLTAESIQGTGPGGRIVRRDVEVAIASKGSTVVEITPVAIPVGGYKDIPHSGMRKAIARRLTESKTTVPHFYLNAPVVADDMLNFRAKYNEWAPKKISVTDLILKTVAASFIDVPQANVIWTDSALRQFSDVDVSIAVATDNGLITPVVRGINHLNLAQLNLTTSDLIDRARIGRLKQNEIEGGSFSVTNLGMYGTDEFSAILNPPQSAILAVGAAKQKPVVIDGEIKIRSIINFTVSVDHRAIDGAVAAQWLAAFVKRFENPYWMAI
jgi:pyruvate dehydrogenase E2 component (dihydrolipoamide acetyltransferase)